MDRHKSLVHPGSSDRLPTTSSRSQQNPAGLVSSPLSPPAPAHSSGVEWASNGSHALNESSSTLITEHAINNTNNNSAWFYGNNHTNNNMLTTTSTTTIIPSNLTVSSSQSKLLMSYNETTVSTNTSTINSTISTTSTTTPPSHALGLELYSDDEQLSSSSSSTIPAYDYYNPPFNGSTASVAPPGSYSGAGGEAAPTTAEPSHGDDLFVNHTSHFTQSGYTVDNASDIGFDDGDYSDVTISGNNVSSASALLQWDSNFTQEDYSVGTTTSTPIAAETAPTITVDYPHTGLGGTQGIHHQYDQQGALPQQEEDYSSSSSSMGNKHPLLQLVNTSAQSHLLDPQRPPVQQATSGYNIYYKILDDPLLPHEGSPPDVRSLEHLCNGTISGSGTSGTILSILTLDSNAENGYLYNITDHVINCTNYSSAISAEEEYDYKNPLLGVLLATFAMITICGNILVMIAVARERYLRTVTNYFIVSLAIADLIIGEYVFSFLLLFCIIVRNDLETGLNAVAYCTPEKRRQYLTKMIIFVNSYPLHSMGGLFQGFFLYTDITPISAPAIIT